jgi:hypothetical protein
MKNIRSILYRFRLLSSVMALAVLLSALAITPVEAAVICDNLCSGWDVKNGCTRCNHCCSFDNGSYTCAPIQDSDCGTGGPGLAD